MKRILEALRRFLRRYVIESECGPARALPDRGADGDWWEECEGLDGSPPETKPEVSRERRDFFMSHSNRERWR